jgi:hypothetical protein
LLLSVISEQGAARGYDDPARESCPFARLIDRFSMDTLGPTGEASMKRPDGLRNESADRIWVAALVARDVVKNVHPKGGKDIVGVHAQHWETPSPQGRVTFTLFTSIYFEEAVGEHHVDLIMHDPSGAILQTVDGGSVKVEGKHYTHQKIYDMANILVSQGFNKIVIAVDGRPLSAVPIEVRLPSN